VEALVTWAELETSKADFFLAEKTRDERKKGNAEADAAFEHTLARRAVSNASARGRSTQSDRRNPSTFLQLLHLANYENALEFAATSRKDIALIHKLITTFAARLGLNAAVDGAPMIFTLQESLGRFKDSPAGKISIGSLVHGYLWTLVEVFDVKQEAAGRKIMDEIARRQRNEVWLNEIRYPALSIDTIAEETLSMTGFSDHAGGSDELIPFDDRSSLVASLFGGYERCVYSPPPSAPSSPGRNFGLSAMERSSSYLGAKQPPQDSGQLAVAKQRMMQTWSKEDCLKNITAKAPRSVSLSARSSPPNGHQPLTGNHRQLLAATNIHNDIHRPSGSSAGGASSSARKGPTRFEELKRVLTGEDPGDLASIWGGGGDDETESMMEVGDVSLGSEDGSVRVGSSAGKPKFDAKALLATIVIGDEPRRNVSGMTEPPYY
jgi:protein EFR3